MDAYILWPSNGLWKVFDPISLEQIAEFETYQDALDYIGCPAR